MLYAAKAPTKKISPCARFLACVILAALAGCRAVQKDQPPTNVVPPNSNVPRELAKVTMPPYVIEPPDLLTIDAVRIVPRSPYRFNPVDVLAIDVTGTLPEAPISGAFAIGPGGLVYLGAPYGSVKVGGMTAEEAGPKLEQHLRQFLRDPQVTVSLEQIAGRQQIEGEHIVAPDGSVTLGTYGSIYVVGMTLAQAKMTIERHLSQFLEAPEVAVNVFAYNSKTYYVITQGANLGDGISRFPITGNETVLDAISQVNGMSYVSSKRIWIARPVPGADECLILPVDWCAITERGSTATNYQVLPGDRVFVSEDKLVAFDSKLGKWISPAERVFGFTMLGASTIGRLGNIRGGAGFGAGF